MSHDTDSTRAAAVDRGYHWRPIASCPRGVKVQLIDRKFGVALYGVFYGRKEDPWTHWAPLPVFEGEP